MIVSHAHKFIFFHNPKCAGTSFREALRPYHDDEFMFWGPYKAPYFKNTIDHTHLRLWELYGQFPRLFSCTETYNSVLFVRNPLARFLSALNEHMKKFQRHIDLSTMSTEEILSTVEVFIQKVLDISKITTDWRFIHFSPQSWFLKFGDQTIPRHIIPMTRDDSFGRKALAALGLPDIEIPRHNPSPFNLAVLQESRIVTRFVREFYADDFEFFLANAALSGLADMESNPA